MKKLIILTIIIILSFVTIIRFGNDLLTYAENDLPSQLIKTPSGEVVQNAKRLPISGSNFQTYSYFLSLIGRTHAHEKVKKVIIKAYHLLEDSSPDVTWVYGEIGWKNGGRFWPHRTHRNGLSTDFIVPVLDAQTQSSTSLLLWPFNWYGYKIRFDDKGRYNNYQINAKALNDHLHKLQLACQTEKVRIKRVIVDATVRKLMEKEANFDLIRNLPFMQGKAWFPHDSHYHIDFEII